MCPGQTLCRALQTKMDKPAISSEKSEHDINGFFPNTPLGREGVDIGLFIKIVPKVLQ